MGKWTKAERAKVADMLRAGMSAGEMAPHFGVSRNAVCGIVFRDKLLRAIGFVRGNGKRAGVITKQSRYAGVLAAPKPKRFEAVNMATRMESLSRGAKPLPAVPTAFECRPVPLMDLKHGDCRWPVNTPARGESYLFCANPADGSYCQHHKAISIGQGTGGERRAVRELERAA